MTFLRRLLGRDAPSTAPAPESDETGDADPVEQARDRDLLREDRARQDELAQRQLRYSRYAWTPPRQGGERRAEDRDESSRQGQSD